VIVTSRQTDRFRLDTLNISSNPLGPLYDNPKTPTLLGLKNLTSLSSTLHSQASLIKLSARVPNLETLRFSLAPDAQLATGTEGPNLSGNDEEDSGVLVALFPNLRLLNGNSVNLKQREDAERRWCSRFTTHEADPTLKRFYDTLSTKHGLHPTPQVIPQSTSLRSKLISKSASCHISELRADIPSTSRVPTIPFGSIHVVDTPLCADLTCSSKGCQEDERDWRWSEIVHREASPG